MQEKLLTVDWKTLCPEEVSEYVRKPLLEARSGEESEDTRRQIMREALLGACEASLDTKMQIYLALCANIAAVPDKKVLFAELISMYTREPEAYQRISTDPFVGDKVYIVSRIGILKRSEFVDCDELRMAEEEDTNQRYLTSACWQGGDLYWFKIDPSPTQTRDYFDLLHAPVEEVTDDQKYRHLQVALSLTTLEHIGTVILPDLWQGVDLGPISAAKLSAGRRSLELIFK